ncbi:MAG: hypothetical protein WKG03_05150 [Telluria sp.]
MNWLRSLFTGRRGIQLAPDAIPVPWAPERIAIFERISACELQADGSLPDPTFDLSDAHSLPECALGPGASDAAGAYHVSWQHRCQINTLCAALHHAADDHTPARLAELYQALLAAPSGGSVIFIERIVKTGADTARMALLARRLARTAPDEIAVTYAIATLGVYGSQADCPLLMTLGLHEAFTQSCAITLCQLLGPEPAQTAMWNLARRVHGWGRIHVVRMLATTGCPEIQQWLLRDGYKNIRMYSYLAYLCATGGKLLPALQAGPADERLLVGAGEIIQALLDGYDAVNETMAHYADGAAATLAYLQCVHRERPQQLQVARALVDIAKMNNYGWDDAHLRHVRHLAKQALALDYWPALVQDKLRYGTDAEFEVAASVARTFHVDPWEFQFAKQQRRERPQWYGLTETTDTTRVDRYVALALEQLDLTAPAGSMDFETRSAISWLAIGLRRFPGKGWPILRAALAGGDDANIANALDTLAKWRRSQWTGEAIAALEHAWRSETRADLKEQMERVLQRSGAGTAGVMGAPTN